MNYLFCIYFKIGLMKKVLVWLIAIVVLILLSATIFLPKQVNDSGNTTFLCNRNSIKRYVIDDKKWAAWWPGNTQKGSSAPVEYFHNGYKYTITEMQYEALLIRVQKGDLTFDTQLSFFPLGPDSIQGVWRYSLSTNFNPINKIYLKIASKKIKDELGQVLQAMKIFLDNPEKVYGVKIHEETVKDTILVTTNFSSANYPTMAQVYQAIAAIRNHISPYHVKETNFPMMHVNSDSSIFKTQVAIPINITIPGTLIYPVKRMVPGRILVAQVIGGDYRARDAMNDIYIYIRDHHMSVPAIPFESLVTDRIQEPDSTKWITKIYYPVF